jgi:hypothetical protein
MKNLTKLLEENPRGLSILLEDAVGEYPLPIQELNIPIQLIKTWDSDNVDETLEWEHNLYNKTFDESESVLKPAREKTFEGFKNSYKENYYNPITESLNEVGSNYFIFHINNPAQYPEFEFEWILNKIGTNILKLWITRGADDDYYDYMPSVTDMFFQLCIIFGAKKSWDRFLETLLKLEGSEVLEESLYRHEFYDYEIKYLKNL